MYFLAFSQIRHIFKKNYLGIIHIQKRAQTEYTGVTKTQIKKQNLTSTPRSSPCLFPYSD